MSFETIARRYAQALFEIGVETNSLQRVADQTKELAQTWQSSADLRTALSNPIITHAERDQLVAELASRMSLDPNVKNAARLLASRNRLTLLPAIARELQRMSDDKGGIARADVTSAKPLSEDYARKLQGELEKMTGKRVILNRLIDPSLIGGVVARVGDTIIDGSIKTRLEEMRARLLSV